MLKLPKYILYDILKNKIIIAYAFFLLLISATMFQMEENNSKAILSLINIVFIVLPLVTIVFTAIHYYNSYEFIELMLSQPISRNKILLSEYLGVSMSLFIAFLFGIGLPVLFYSPNKVGISFVFVGSILTWIFTGLAFLSCMLARDKAKGIGIALLLWLYFTLIYDGLVLLIMFAFSDYPLEKATIALSSMNPIDLSRIIIMLQTDMSAIMGYTGALFREFFGNVLGYSFSFVVLFLWMITPLWISVNIFRKKDL